MKKQIHYSIIRSFIFLFSLSLIPSFLVGQTSGVKNMADDGSVHFLSYNGTYQDRVVPATTGMKYLKITTRGGDGGPRINTTLAKPFETKGGGGASYQALFEIGSGANKISAGDTIRYIIGGNGEVKNSIGSNGAGGGGGTGVFLKKAGSSSWKLLMVAGAGGGAFSDCCSSYSEGRSARTGPDGGDGGGAGYSNDGGTGGDDGEDSVVAFGGGGINSVYFNDEPQGAIDGAFGCGFGGEDAWAGGGGGGYSGGGAAEASASGGGGGSYLTDEFLSYYPEVYVNPKTNDPKNGNASYKFYTVLPDLSTIKLEADTDKCLDLDHNNASNGTNIQIWGCNETGAQSWVFDGGYIVLKRNPQYCLSMTSYDPKDGDNIHLWECKGKDNQEWFYDGITHSIRHKADPDYCLTLDGSNIELNTCTEGNSNQQWRVANTDMIDITSEERINSINVEAVQTVVVYPQDGKTNNASPVTTQNMDASMDQGLRFNPDGSISITKRPDRCLDQLSGSTANGTKIQVFPCTGYSNQKWFYDSSNQQFRAYNDPDKCMKGGLSGGASIILWTCSNTIEQHFIVK